MKVTGTKLLTLLGVPTWGISEALATIVTLEWPLAAVAAPARSLPLPALPAPSPTHPPPRGTNLEH